MSNEAQISMDLIPPDDFTNQRILALNWREPFGSLMLHGKVETRTWNADYRGLVLICTSQKPYTEGDIIGISGERMAQTILLKHLKEITGHAIAIGRLAACRQMIQNYDEEKTYVKYRNGLYCHIYEDVRAIEPIPWKGKLGWQKVSLEVKRRIKLI